MIKISMREFSHHIAEYMQRTQKGEQFVIMKRKQPIADVLPHQQGKLKPGWSLEMPRRIAKDVSLAKELIKFREQER